MRSVSRICEVPPSISVLFWTHRLLVVDTSLSRGQANLGLLAQVKQPINLRVAIFNEFGKQPEARHRF